MITVSDKKEFYKMLQKDRYPVARIEFPTELKVGRIEFYNTPLGTLICVNSGGSSLNEIKMYDKREGSFELKNIFCRDDLICIEDCVYVGIASRIQIQDVIGRKFLIKLANISVIARAEFIKNPLSDIDKTSNLVYN